MNATATCIKANQVETEPQVGCDLHLERLSSALRRIAEGSCGELPELSHKETQEVHIPTLIETARRSPARAQWAAEAIHAMGGDTATDALLTLLLLPGQRPAFYRSIGLMLEERGVAPERVATSLNRVIIEGQRIWARVHGALNGAFSHYRARYQVYEELVRRL